MQTTKKNILIIAPELSVMDQSVFDLILLDVDLLISSARFGNKAELAKRYLAAHILTVIKSTSKESSGAVSSEKVGAVSKDYESLNVKDITRYDTTSYGRQYVSIRKSVVVGFMVVTP